MTAALRKLASEALEAAEKAHAGPWAASGTDVEAPSDDPTDPPGAVIDVIASDVYDDVDAYFIAHARQAVPALATAVLRLLAVVEKMQRCQADKCLYTPKCLNVAHRDTQDGHFVCDEHKGPDGYTLDLTYAAELRALEGL